MKIQPPSLIPYSGYSPWDNESHQKYLAWRAKQKKVKPLEEVINNASQVGELYV